ncbi:MAG: alpha-amylase family glycosyl hydrolase [Lentisphaeria bacterium]|nr:alpha-amylase family glycosyl hydrolase [Lentisphaeria bacterium]
MENRVLLQGFYWESFQSRNNTDGMRWYQLVRSKADQIRSADFDLIWLPPPSYAGEKSAGYNPKEYYNLNNSYGSEKEQEALLRTLNDYGIDPIADIVINHRDGSTGWAAFQNPTWGTNAITQSDEAFNNPASEVVNTPLGERGGSEEQIDYAPGRLTYAYDSYRDIDHNNAEVRRDIIRFLGILKSMGYKGWRYDMVHGYHAKWVALYNKETNPSFSVGEYDWDRQGEQRGWIMASNFGTEKYSSVFDFSTWRYLRENINHPVALYGPDGKGFGLIADRTDGINWAKWAVTFVENHDTGEREGRPPGHDEDSVENNHEVRMAYAYILSHPGLPSVFWKHYFDWGEQLQDTIDDLIQARKRAGVHAESKVHFQNNAKERGVYAAAIEGDNNKMLLIRIGGTDTQWHPEHSGYMDCRLMARGENWKVWILN